MFVFLKEYTFTLYCKYIDHKNWATYLLSDIEHVVSSGVPGTMSLKFVHFFRILYLFVFVLLPCLYQLGSNLLSEVVTFRRLQCCYFAVSVFQKSLPHSHLFWKGVVWPSHGYLLANSLSEVVLLWLTY